METQVQLPPSERDFEVYRLVKVEQRSTRAAAQALGISQTRVCQVVERVAAFLIEVAPAAEDDVRHGQRMHVAEQVAAERIDFLYFTAVRSFRQSKGEQTTVREVESGLRPKVTITTTRESYGDIRLLMTAAKLVMLAGKLPLPMLGSAGLGAEDEGDDDADEVVPPKEDCSAKAGEQGAAATELAKKDAATRLQEINYMQDVLAKMRAEGSQSAPVQPAALRPAATLPEKAQRARKAFLGQVS